jgi:hypothetical protein
MHSLVRQLALGALELRDLAGRRDHADRRPVLRLALGRQLRRKPAKSAAAAEGEVDGAAFAGRQNAPEARLPHGQERLVTTQLAVSAPEEVPIRVLGRASRGRVQVLVAQMGVVEGDAVGRRVKDRAQLRLDPTQLRVGKSERVSGASSVLLSGHPAGDVARQPERADDRAVEIA